MISELLPKTVAFAEAFEDSGEDGLYPAERELLGKAVERRRREFATVRACARRALGELGLPPAPVLPGVRNVPQWPAGIVGSMTHCDGYRAALLARVTDQLTVGIDAEPDAPLPEGVLESIALPREAAWVGARVPGDVHRGRLLFSAKECVYKAWFPMMGSELDFADAEIAFSTTARSASGTAGTFEARILRPGLPGPGPRPDSVGRQVPGFSGHWAAWRGLLVTTIVLAAPAGG